MKHLSFILAASAFLFSCTTPQYTGTAVQPEEKLTGTPDPITQSLFNDKSATITEEHIQKILDGSYTLPQQLRVAIVKIDNGSSNRSYYSGYWNDEQYLKTQQAYLNIFTDKLKQSPRVTTVAIIPDLLVAKPAGFTNIREAAVRMQADIVVVYAISADIYSKYKVFTKPAIKAFATTQLIVLDVRTGLIPFSTIVSKDQLSKKQPEELDNNEAANRIQKEAVLLTIDEISRQLTAFLGRK